MWRLGRVNKLIICNDGQIRGAALEVNTNGRLYPLEVEQGITADDKTSTAEGEGATQNGQMNTQPDTPTFKASKF